MTYVAISFFFYYFWNISTQRFILSTYPVFLSAIFTQGESSKARKLQASQVPQKIILTVVKNVKFTEYFVEGKRGLSPWHILAQAIIKLKVVNLALPSPQSSAAIRVSSLTLYCAHSIQVTSPLPRGSPNSLENNCVFLAYTLKLMCRHSSKWSVDWWSSRNIFHPV